MNQNEDYFELLVPAARFADYGGWTLDSQFASEMGSSYLLAHGIGIPCRDAETTVQIPSAGEYRVWVRTKDWVPEYHPGRFQVLVNGEPIPGIFGENGKDWSWELVEHVSLPAGETKISLHDMTGFDGRCDCLYITNTTNVPPFRADEAMRLWRKRLLGLSGAEAHTERNDVVIVGAGKPGICAAYAAAKEGLRAALIGDRPCLGGNASKEIGLTPEAELGPVVTLLSERK